MDMQTMGYILGGGAALFVVLVVLVALTRANDHALERIIDATPPPPAPAQTPRGPWLDDAGPMWASDWTPMTTYGLGPTQANPNAPGGAWAVERARPVRTLTRESDAAVPAIQAAVTALCATLLVGAVCGLVLRMELADVGRAAGLTFAAVLALSWLWRLGVATAALSVIETATQRDVNGAIGRPLLLNPGEAREHMRGIQRDAGRESATAELLAFVRRCYTTGTSEASHDARPGTKARESYVRQRDLLMRLGLAEWKNPDSPRAGWTLTADRATAEAVIAEHVSEL